MEELKNKVCIVTGGGRGLGRSMALGLAKAGAKVVITAAREKDEIEKVAKEGGDHSIYPVLADVTKFEDCEKVVESAKSRFGDLHILINNAGRGMKYVSENFLETPPKFWEADVDSWKMVIDTNVIGPFLMAKAALPHMLLNNWGRIINISMNQSTMRRKGFSPYGHSKAALESETIIWSQDLEGTGVTVNALLPGGATATGMIPENVSDPIKKILLDPDIIVPPLLWLASPLSDGVTGKRLDASLWKADLDSTANVANSIDVAGWV